MIRKQLKNIAIYIAIFFVGIIVGIIIFNYIVMPGIVGVGDVSKIPYLVGISFEKAEEITEEKNFKLEINYKKYDPGFGTDTVVSQIPKPGTPAKEGRTIKVVVSLGGRKIRIPDFCGLTERQAEIQLDHLGLVKGKVFYDNSDSILKGNVIKTLPPAGEEVPESTRVDLVVSLYRASPYVTVPNFIGRPVAEAESLAIYDDLNIKVIYRKIPAVDPKRIYKQSHAPDEQIARDDTITLIVNMGEHY